MPSWVSPPMALMGSSLKILAFSYLIKRFTEPSLASSNEASEELEDLVSIERLRSFWSLLKAPAGFFFLMAKISS